MVAEPVMAEFAVSVTVRFCVPGTYSVAPDVAFAGAETTKWFA
jgi:hypothetical protein